MPWVFAEIARHLQDGERIRVIVQDVAAGKRVSKAFESSCVSINRVDFVRGEADRSWTRDFLPLFVVRKRGKARELGAVKWRFNGWARYKIHKRDEEMGATIAREFGG